MTTPNNNPVFDIQLAMLFESPDNPRRTFPEKKLAELAASIASVGIIEPLVARPRDAETFWLVAGARRYRAAVLAGLDSAPVRVMDLDDRQALELSITENLQRENPHPFEEGQGFAALIERAGYTTATVAERVGKGEDYVRQRLKLMSLAPKVAAAFLAEEITFSHAVQIAPLVPADQEAALDFLQRKDNHQPSANQLTHWLQEEIYLDLGTAVFDITSPDLGAVPCADCPKRTGYDPMLFPEVRGKDTCTDAECYRGKSKAHLIQIEKVLRKQGGAAPLRLHGDWYPMDKALLPRSQWNEAQPGCPTPATGLIVASNSQDYPAGKVVRVCRAKDCPVHFPARDKETRKSADVLAERRRDWEFETTRLSQTAVLAELIDKHPPKLSSRVDLEVVARQCFGRLYAENRKKILRRREWIPANKQPASNEYEAIVTKRFKDMTDTQVFGFLLEVAVCDDAFATFGRYGGTGTFAKTNLYQAAVRQGVAADAILKGIQTSRAARFQTKYGKLLDAAAAEANKKKPAAKPEDKRKRTAKPEAKRKISGSSKATKGATR